MEFQWNQKLMLVGELDNEHVLSGKSEEQRKEFVQVNHYKEW